MTLVTKLRLMGTALIGAMLALAEASLRLGTQQIVPLNLGVIILVVTLFCIHFDAERAVNIKALEKQFLESVNNIVAPYSLTVIGLWIFVTPVPPDYSVDVLWQKVILIAVLSFMLVTVPMMFVIITKKLRR